MSRVDRYEPRGRRKRGIEPKEETAGSDLHLPPRRVKHPSNKQQMANWFYNSLIALFAALVFGLIFFGRHIIGN